MIFSEISERYFSGTDAERAASLLEFVNYQGNTIASGESTQQSSFLARGDGFLEYRRRGDFMERGDAFPGVWLARCEQSELAEVWNKLGDLGPDSFPTRVADPGEGSSRLSTCISQLSESLSWGPPDHSQIAPGSEFLSALNPLILKAQEGVPLWSVEMKLASISRLQEGLQIDVELINYGSDKIGFLLPFPIQGGGIRLRYAPAREVSPGITPLPVSWNWEDLSLPKQKSPSLWTLFPESPVRIRLKCELELVPGRTYLGKLEYEQRMYLDRFVGCPVLTGSCFTDSFRFQV
jgi:hypothetical protein